LFIWLKNFLVLCPGWIPQWGAWMPDRLFWFLFLPRRSAEPVGSKEQHIEKLCATWGSSTFHLLLFFAIMTQRLHFICHAFCLLALHEMPALPSHDVPKASYLELSQSGAYILLSYLSFNSCPSNDILKIGLNLSRLQ
jgi:hypothetical protein